MTMMTIHNDMKCVQDSLKCPCVHEFVYEIYVGVYVSGAGEIHSYHNSHINDVKVRKILLQFTAFLRMYPPFILEKVLFSYYMQVIPLLGTVVKRVLLYTMFNFIALAPHNSLHDLMSVLKIIYTYEN